MRGAQGLAEQRAQREGADGIDELLEVVERRASCAGLHLNLLALACLQYESDYGTLPPAYIADQTGRPAHSWRVLILPYLDRNDLYRRYDFSQPWDAPQNRKVASQMPQVYRCPASRTSRTDNTNYLAVVGPGTAWPGDQGLSTHSMRDGPSWTMLLVEVADSDIVWTQPKDLTLEEAAGGVNGDRRRGISSDHHGGAFCALADGGEVFLPNDTEPKVVRALLTVAGGEEMNMTDSGVYELMPGR